MAKSRTIALLVAVMATQHPAMAGRNFTYSYQPKTAEQGEFEFEQWVTARVEKEDGHYQKWESRSELEYGLTDLLTTAFYLNLEYLDVSRVTGFDEERDFEFNGVSSEWKYLSRPEGEGAIGVLLYGEVSTDIDEELELEEKLVLGKTWGKWTAAANIIVEQAWKFEGGLDDTEQKESELEFSTGISRRMNERWFLGLEGRNHRRFGGLYLESQNSSAWYLGPAVEYDRDEWWVTLTFLPQLAGTPDTYHGLELVDHERVEVRLIVGFEFE